jgi:hypothetical protein
MNYPINVEDITGLVITLRDDVSNATKNNFGNGEYVLDISSSIKLLDVPASEKIRMFPIEEYPNGRVHMLGCIMGYDMIKHRFKIVRKL